MITLPDIPYKSNIDISNSKQLQNLFYEKLTRLNIDTIKDFYDLSYWSNIFTFYSKYKMNHLSKDKLNLLLSILLYYIKYLDSSENKLLDLEKKLKLDINSDKYFKHFSIKQNQKIIYDLLVTYLSSSSNYTLEDIIPKNTTPIIFSDISPDTTSIII